MLHLARSVHRVNFILSRPTVLFLDIEYPLIQSGCWSPTPQSTGKQVDTDITRTSSVQGFKTEETHFQSK